MKIFVIFVLSIVGLVILGLIRYGLISIGSYTEAELEEMGVNLGRKEEK